MFKKINSVEYLNRMLHTKSTFMKISWWCKGGTTISTLKIWSVFVDEIVWQQQGP